MALRASKQWVFPLRPKNSLALASKQILLQNSFIHHNNEKGVKGFISILPLGMRVLRKIEKIVIEELEGIGALPCQLPVIQEQTLWEKTNRINAFGKEIFQMTDRSGVKFCLAPTHEEWITRCMVNKVNSYKSLPILLYQIGSKFRDEVNADGSLIRSREFIMKDMYSFDADIESARETYYRVLACYSKIFQRIGFDDKQIEMVEAETGNIGGSKSHEFLFSATNEKDQKPIELGHAFLLEKKYSKVFDAKFQDAFSKFQHFEMGCFGIGITRILGCACRKVLDRDDSPTIWPKAIAPYHVSIIPRVDDLWQIAAQFQQKLIERQQSTSNISTSDIIFDDRKDLGLGHKIKDAKAIGIPYVAIIKGYDMVNDSYDYKIECTATGKEVELNLFGDYYHHHPEVTLRQ